MKYLWLLWLPLLYLPDLGLERSTMFGTLQLSDILIGPYLSLALLGARRSDARRQLLVDRLVPWMLGFIWWACISTLLFPMRYTYLSNEKLIFSLLKLGKLSLYGVGGVLTTKALSSGRAYHWYDWSLLAAGFLVGISLIVSRYQIIQHPSATAGEFDRVVKDNALNALIAMLICYLTGRWLGREGTPIWQRVTPLVLVTMALGFLLARGRGGWLAALTGALYLVQAMRLKRSLLIGIAVISLVLFAYNRFPSFRSEIDKTLWPDRAYRAHMEQYGAGVLGIDEGARLRIWQEEGEKYLQNPLFGRGFFHRGGRSGLDPSGSHNFFLQMFLETGVGGIMVLCIFWSMWRHAGKKCTKSRCEDTRHSTRAALIAAVVAGLSGEYFYGGIVLFTLLLIYSPVGCQKADVVHIPTTRVLSGGDAFGRLSDPATSSTPHKQ